MFNKKKKEGENMESAETIVGNDVVIKGNLKSPSNILVHGVVKGQVTTETDANVGEGSRIEGSVTGKNVTIAGEVQGNIEAGESLRIEGTGVVNGDIKTPSLVIQEGAKFLGKCEMPVETREDGEGEENEGQKEEIEEILETEEVEEAQEEPQ